GEVALRVHNQGPDKHELIVARVGTSGAAGLPLRADGVTLDEEAPQKAEVGELEPGAPGGVRTLRLKLAPGHYVFFCNMAGHFLGGMHADVVVQYCARERVHFGRSRRVEAAPSQPSLRRSR